MYKNKEEKARLKDFKRNKYLEDFLTEINGNLFVAEKKLFPKENSQYPILFLVGPQRSGSTLTMQWLASLGHFAYPTNLLSRFYGAPMIGAKIQQLLTNEKYNFRNEILDFISTINFYSENGKTKGALAPNEFWYFWRRFLPFTRLDYLTSQELFKKVDLETLKAEIIGLTEVFQKPLVFKGMVLNYNIDFLNKLFRKIIFIHIKRDPLTNIESTLDARKRQLGSINEWYSFKIPEYYKLKKLNPYEQVAGQIYYINKAVENGLKKVSENKKMILNYEAFCNNPQEIYDELLEKLETQGCRLDKKYKGEKKFKVTRKKVVNKEILKAYNKFYKK